MSAIATRKSLVGDGSAQISGTCTALSCAIVATSRTMSLPTLSDEARHTERGHSMIVFDAGKIRPYRAADLDELLRFVGECNRAPDAGAIRHPGDVIHFMSNSLRGRDLERHIFLYEESGGLLRALVMLYPGATWYYELLLDPELRSPDDDAFETAALVWAGDAAWSASQATGSTPEGRGRRRDRCGTDHRRHCATTYPRTPRLSARHDAGHALYDALVE